VIGLGITRILTGIGYLVQLRGQVRNYWIHLMWAHNTLLYMVLMWWVQYRWSARADWTFFLALFVLLGPIVVFLNSVLLFPDDITVGYDMKVHFYTNSRPYFLLAAALVVIDVLDTLLKGWDHFIAQGVPYMLTMPLLTVLSLIASATHNERFHAFYCIFFLAYLLVFIAINLLTLA
jgi:hypothetical protein